MNSRFSIVYVLIESIHAENISYILSSSTKFGDLGKDAAARYIETAATKI